MRLPWAKGAEGTEELAGVVAQQSDGPDAKNVTGNRAAPCAGLHHREGREASLRPRRGNQGGPVLQRGYGRGVEGAERIQGLAGTEPLPNSAYRRGVEGI